MQGHEPPDDFGPLDYPELQDAPAPAPAPADPPSSPRLRAVGDDGKPKPTRAELFSAQLEALARPWRGEMPPPKQWANQYLAVGPGRPAMLCAPPGSGKGWTALALALCVASGAGLGELSSEGEAQPVVWLDYEEGDYELQRRQALLCTGMGIAPQALEAFRSYSMPPKLSEPAMKGWLSERLKGVRLCVVDTLTAAWTVQDRNDAGAALPLEMLTAISDATGCSMLVVYHTRKASKDTADALEQEKVLGSQAIIGACQCIWMGAKVGKNALLWNHAKVNGAQASDPFEFRWSWQEPHGGIAFSATRSAPVATTTGSAKELDRHTATAELQRALIEAVAAKPGLTGNAIAALVGKNRANVLAQLELLSNARAIRWEQGANRSKFYYPVTESGGSGTTGPSDAVLDD